MRPSLNDWTIVVVGQWNPHIFTPPWLGRELLHVENVHAEFTVSPTRTSSLRYTAGSLVVIPSEDRLTVGVRNTSNEVLTEAENVIKGALRLLTHTPVRAMGVNFAFTEDDVPSNILQTLQLADSATLSDAGFTVTGTEIIRKIPLASALLNLKLSYAETVLKIHLNFHNEVSSASQAADTLEGSVLRYRDQAVQILRDVFALHIEEDTQHGH